MSFPSIKKIPMDFVWRRLHSLAGIGLVIFIISHLITNSQAALLIGDDGAGFIRSVNAIHSIPYLTVIEIGALAIPILIHLAWGINYLRTAEPNSYGGDGSVPYLPKYPRNRAYTWQRITSWILAIGIIAHVIHMRFVEYPDSAINGSQKEYLVRITRDQGLQTLAERLGVKLYDAEQVQGQKWLSGLHGRQLTSTEVIAAAPDFGTADLLVVRDTFKMPLMIALYTLLVLAACFHAFNGLSTFMITWGVTLTERAQRYTSYVSILLMAVFSFLGLSAVWLTYWVNLKS